MNILGHAHTHKHTHMKESKLYNTCKSTCQIACFLQFKASKAVAGNESKWRTKMSPTCSLNCGDTHILAECKQMSQKRLWNHDRTEMSLPRKGGEENDQTIQSAKRLTIQLSSLGTNGEAQCWTTSQFFTGFLPFSLTGKRTLRMSSSLLGLPGAEWAAALVLLILSGEFSKTSPNPRALPHSRSQWALLLGQFTIKDGTIFKRWYNECPPLLAVSGSLDSSIHYNSKPQLVQPSVSGTKPCFVSRLLPIHDPMQECQPWRMLRFEESQFRLYSNHGKQT